jgi:hypothetical protein
MALPWFGHVKIGVSEVNPSVGFGIRIRTDMAFMDMDPDPAEVNLIKGKFGKNVKILLLL